MKKALRIIPLILALALLAACGAEPAAETPDVTGAETQPTASPEAGGGRPSAVFHPAAAGAGGFGLPGLWLRRRGILPR